MRGTRLASSLALGAVLLAACAAPGPRPPTGTAAPGVAPPVPCQSVLSGADLQPIIDATPDGTALCLAPGMYAGPLTIARAITLWGPRDAVIVSPGEGTTVRLRGAGAALLGLSIHGSGTRYDHQDAAVHVGADAVRVEGVEIRDAVFGIIADRVRGVTVRANHIVGSGDAALGMRGDAIRFWEVYGSSIEDNVVAGSRDLAVWYAADNRITGNTITGGRYGTHFMYSRATRIDGNRYQGNVVGIFAMYSRDLVLRDNALLESAGAAGIGLGIKESSNLDVASNLLAKNTVGVYIDNSPFVPGTVNRFAGNVVRDSTTGVLFHSSPHDSVFAGNSFRGNLQQVAVDGGGHALAITWRGNDFDDYAGYDLDRDGVGDIPYELRSLSNHLTGTYPSLAFLRGTPALALSEAISHLVPLFRPKALVVDPAPRLAPGTAAHVDADRAA